MLLWVLGCTELQSMAMSLFPLKYETPMVEATVADVAVVELSEVITGMPQITEMVFVPTQPNYAIVLQKEGDVLWVDVAAKTKSLIAHIEVRSASEQGLLGMAFHPDFSSNGLLYLHLSPKDGDARTEVSEFRLAKDQQGFQLEKTRVLFEYPQPYPNHNGGALRIGPDRHLYLGLGDGGWRNDPEANGQNFATPLGGILRFSIDGESVVPIDNPFVQEPSVEDLLWVTGVRNPWKFSMLSDGGALIADVGQNAWEEISYAKAGDNLGWNLWEGEACLTSDCPIQDQNGKVFTKPVHTYGHDVGQSITGGVVMTGEHPYQGYYIFGDFMTGKVWTLSNWTTNPTVDELIQVPYNISTFAQSSDGKVYLVDFGPGTIYQFVWSN